jgi:hypothetical protein
MMTIAILMSTASSTNKTAINLMMDLVLLLMGSMVWFNESMSEA